MLWTIDWFGSGFQCLVTSLETCPFYEQTSISQDHVLWAAFMQEEIPKAQTRQSSCQVFFWRFRNFCAKKLLVVCWWNWPLITFESQLNRFFFSFQTKLLWNRWSHFVKTMSNPNFRWFTRLQQPASSLFTIVAQIWFANFSTQIASNKSSIQTTVTCRILTQSNTKTWGELLDEQRCAKTFYSIVQIGSSLHFRHWK